MIANEVCLAFNPARDTSGLNTEFIKAFSIVSRGGIIFVFWLKVLLASFDGGEKAG